MDVSSLVAELEDTDVKIEKHSPYPVWKIKPSWTQPHKVLTAKSRILEFALSLRKTCYLDYSEDPTEWEIPGSWLKTPSGSWVVPSDVNASQLLEKFLYLGNWLLYVCDHAQESNALPDFFRSRPEEITSLLSSSSIDLVISSFHDDSPWVVAVSNTLWEGAC